MFETQLERRVREILLQYHDVEPDGSFVRGHGENFTSLKFRPCPEVASDGVQLESIAEVTTTLVSDHLRDVDERGIAELNARAVHGAFVRNSRGDLEVRAQFALYPDEPALDLMEHLLLGVFGGQLAMAWAGVKTWANPHTLDKEAEYQEMPRSWSVGLPATAFSEVAEQMSQRGIAATAREDGVTAEVALEAGSAPSRMHDLAANTALLTVQTAAVHPLAGAGYLATIALPMHVPASKAPAVCAYLNEVELQRTDFVPCIGAWGVRERGRRVAYSSFIPTPSPIGMFHRTLLWWMVLRVQALLGDGFFEGTSQARSEES